MPEVQEVMFDSNLLSVKKEAKNSKFFCFHILI